MALKPSLDEGSKIKNSKKATELWLRTHWIKILSLSNQIKYGFTYIKTKEGCWQQ